VDNSEASPLRQAAIMAHEMYQEFKDVGFSRREALELVSRVITGGIASAMDEGNNKSD
jgi:hypothetical protein